MKVIEHLGWRDDKQITDLDITTDNGEFSFYEEDELVCKIDILIEDDLFNYVALELRRIDNFKKG